MASAIEQLRSGLTIGHAQLGMHGSRQGTINQQVHDGDTVVSLLEGNVGIRFWAWTPLRSASPSPAATDSSASRIQPGRHSSPTHLPPPCPHSTRRSPASSKTSSPESVKERPLITPGWAGPLLTRYGSWSASTSRCLGQTEASFRFFCAFAHEVMDGFGRLLCFLNRQQSSATDPAPRPRSYNERIPLVGMARRREARIETPASHQRERMDLLQGLT